MSRYRLTVNSCVLSLLWVCLALIALTVSACARAATDSDAEPIRNITLEALDGSLVNLADYRGHVVLVNFWATWCGPCRSEMPELDAYYQAHRHEGFVLLAVNAGERSEKVRDFIARGGYTFPVLLDSDGVAARAFGGIRGMPTSFVLDGRGKTVYQQVGVMTAESLAAQVSPFLNGIGQPIRAD